VTTEQLPSAAQQAPVGAGGMKVIVSAGRRVASGFVRVSKRFTTRVAASLPSTIQPKLLAGVSSQAWASASMPEVDHV
jgi:hypothetical protein